MKIHLIIAFISSSTIGLLFSDNEKITPFYTQNLPTNKVDQGEIPQEIKTEKTIHIQVALCDNKTQGNIPVPTLFGRGDDPSTNLFWGAKYGVKTDLLDSGNWELLSTEMISPIILERIIMKHKHYEVYLVIDAYNGSDIQYCMEDYMNGAFNTNYTTIAFNDRSLGLHSRADLLVYVGHNALMDKHIDPPLVKEGLKAPDLMLFTSFGKQLLEPILKNSKAKVLFSSDGLISPDEFTLESELAQWVDRETIDTNSEMYKLSIIEDHTRPGY